MSKNVHFLVTQWLLIIKIKWWRWLGIESTYRSWEQDGKDEWNEEEDKDLEAAVGMRLQVCPVEDQESKIGANETVYCGRCSHTWLLRAQRWEEDASEAGEQVQGGEFEGADVRFQSWANH